MMTLPVIGPRTYVSAASMSTRIGIFVSYLLTRTPPCDPLAAPMLGASEKSPSSSKEEVGLYASGGPSVPAWYDEYCGWNP